MGRGYIIALIIISILLVSGISGCSDKDPIKENSQESAAKIAEAPRVLVNTTQNEGGGKTVSISISPVNTSFRRSGNITKNFIDELIGKGYKNVTTSSNSDLDMIFVFMDAESDKEIQLWETLASLTKWYPDETYAILLTFSPDKVCSYQMGDVEKDIFYTDVAYSEGGVVAESVVRASFSALDKYSEYCYSPK